MEQLGEGSGGVWQHGFGDCWDLHGGEWHTWPVFAPANFAVCNHCSVDCLIYGLWICRDVGSGVGPTDDPVAKCTCVFSVYSNNNNNI